MDWAMVFTIIGTNLALFLWDRTESRADNRELRSEFVNFKTEIRGWHHEIQQEMKDFHGRLCSLDERMRKDP